MNVEKLGKCIIGKLQDRIYMKYFDFEIFLDVEVRIF